MMKIQGSCHCGGITYEADVDPATVSICHCTDCQTLSGTAFRTVVVATKANFRLKGEPTIYIKTAESGNKRVQAFCPRCGSPIYSADPVDPQAYSIRLGTAKQRDELVPKRQIWTRSACNWLERIPDIEKHAKKAG
jgi:hypothetical protein